MKPADAEGRPLRRDLMHRALDLLSRRAYSRAELALRLAEPRRRRRPARGAGGARGAAGAAATGVGPATPPADVQAAPAGDARDGSRPAGEADRSGGAPTKAELAAVLAELERLGLLDDAAYARAFVAGRLRSRPEPPERLVARLRARGIADAVARAVVDETLAALEPLDLARVALARVWSRYAGLPREAAARRAGRFLLSRGFDPETARRAVWDRLGEVREDC